MGGPQFWSILRRRAAGILVGTVLAVIATVLLRSNVLLPIEQSVQMRSWVSIPAELLSSTLEQNEAGNRAQARYRYAFAGRSYEGSRLGVHAGYDNIGRWHREIFDRIQRAPLRVWVNPAQAHEAVFDRDLRWDVLSFFIAVVAALMLAAAMVVRLAWRSAPGETAARHGGRPRIYSRERDRRRLPWWFAILWNSFVTSAVWLDFFGRHHNESMPDPTGRIIVTLVGLGAIIYAVRRTLEWWRFGDVSIRLENSTLKAGGVAIGDAHLPVAFQPDFRFTVSLTVAEARTVSYGAKPKRQRRIVWHDTQQGEVVAESGGTRVSFRFGIPNDLTVDDNDAGFEGYSCTLRIHGGASGSRLQRSFDIPIEFTDRSPPERESEPTVPERMAIPDSVVRIRPARDGMRLQFPGFQRSNAGTLALATGLVLLLAQVFHSVFNAGRTPDAPFLIDFFVFLGVPLILAGIYLSTNGRQLSLTSDGMRIRRTLLGFSRERYVAKDQIAKIEKCIGMQIGNGRDRQVSYRIRLISQSGQEIVIADGLPGASVAERLVVLMREALADGAPKASPR